MIKNTKEKVKVCELAYTRLEINGMTGEASFCCPSFTFPYTLGNFHNCSFDEIWNGKKAQALRQTMIDGNYKYCRRDLCAYNGDDIYTDYKKFTTIADSPEIVELAPSSVCNVRCIFCRDGNGVYPIEKDKNFFKKMLPKYLETIKNAKFLNLNQCGEALADAHCKILLQEALKINPKLKIGLLTNGKLCNKKTLDKYGISDNLYWVSVSVHATSKATYEKIVRGSNFDTVKKNVEYLAKQKNAGKIERVTINFVVNVHNYKEMPDFANWAKELGIDCEIWETRQYEGEDEDSLPLALREENFKKIAVFLPTHPEYKELVKVLQNPILKEDFCFVNNYLTNLK